MKINSKTILTYMLLLFIAACGKDDTDLTPVDLKGKIAPSLSMVKDGDIEFFDLRDANNPQKAAFNIIGTADNFYLEYVKSRPIGANTIQGDYGDLSINHNNEVYLADRNWPGWSNVSTTQNWIVMNNDNTDQLYPFYQSSEDSTELYSYTSFYSDFASIGSWGTPGTINSCIEVYEGYNGTSYTRNAFYINLETQEYLFDRDLNSSGEYSSGYQITDLIRQPNGNMYSDPIDWTKADFAFCLSYNHNYESFIYNGKDVIIFVFVDLDAKMYAAFLRNMEDDPVNGADIGRQTLLTISWQPLSALLVGWDL